MKRILLIAGVLMFLNVNVSKAQIVQSTTGYSTSEVKEKLKYFSYRGSLEVSALTGNMSGVQFRVVPLGFQCSPSLHLGLGMGLTVVEDYYEDYYEDISIFLTSKYNVNALGFGGNTSFVPFASAILGVSCYTDKPMVEVRVGLTMLSRSKKNGLSLFLGYQYMTMDEYSSYSDSFDLPYSALNIGLSWEFGGKGGFNKRPRGTSN